MDDCLHLLDDAMGWLQERINQRAPGVDLAVEAALVGRVRSRIVSPTSLEVDGWLVRREVSRPGSVRS